jgi:outer membrane protein OmpA-like peptidoglycan-associated protein
MTPLDPNEHLCEGWEQVREEIYRENERHNLLQKKISYYMKNPPPPPVLTRTIVTRIDTLVLPDILFATGKSDLQPSSFSLLDSFCRGIGERRIDSIVVEGHTDSAGSLSLNEKLSLDRAEAVRTYLQRKLTGAQIRARGWAFSRPVAGNSTPEERQKNRRVEVFLYVRD